MEVELSASAASLATPPASTSWLDCSVMPDSPCESPTRRAAAAAASVACCAALAVALYAQRSHPHTDHLHSSSSFCAVLS